MDSPAVLVQQVGLRLLVHVLTACKHVTFESNGDKGQDLMDMRLQKSVEHFIRVGFDCIRNNTTESLTAHMRRLRSQFSVDPIFEKFGWMPHPKDEIYPGPIGSKISAWTHLTLIKAPKLHESAQEGSADQVQKSEEGDIITAFCHLMKFNCCLELVGHNVEALVEFTNILNH
jgi:hypothetical protein